MSIQETLTETRSPASLCRRIAGSIVAPFTASAAFGILFLTLCFVEDGTSRWWVLPSFVVGIATAFSFSTWLFVVLPFYLFVSPHSILWSWPFCTACGALSCAAIVVSWGAIFHPHASDRFFFWFIAAIIGGATCLTASLTRRRFLYQRNA